MAAKAEKAEKPGFVHKRWRVEIPRRRPGDAPLNGIDNRLKIRFDNGVAFVTTEREANIARNCGYKVTEAGNYRIEPDPEPEAAAK